MRVIAAYLLAVVSGQTPDKATIEKILGSVAIAADGAKIDALIKELEGKDLDALMKEGLEKLGAAAPVGGGGGGGGAAAGGAAPAAAVEKEKEESSEEESEADMGFSLFD